MSQYSIKDIAKLANVSIATVSRVINSKGKYSEKTRRKVLKVIRETGYEIDSSAQSLRTNVTHTIGILVPDIKNSFFADLVQKIEEKLFEKEYSTIICNTDKNEQKEKAYLRMLENKKVDGIIVISGSYRHGFHFESLLKTIPYICIDREPADFEDTIFISSNHQLGAKEATKYFIGVHDFKAFTPNKDKRNSYVREIYEINIQEENDILTFTFRGNGFIKYKIRKETYNK